VTSAAPIQTSNVTPFQRKGIRFPARSFLAFALAPEAPLEDWLESLDHWTENSPAFFAGRPVVLDLNILKPKASEIAGLVSKFAERGIRIYAIEANGLDSLDPGLPPLLKGARPTGGDERQAQPPAASPDRKEASASLMIKTPIRSGQSVYHPHGDVIVLGAVSSGSEIVAGGSIHVYGTLRGRAIAGASGNAQARIFCRRNEAELLAVDGWYRTADDMEPASRGKPIQVFLEDEVIQIAILN
jgi:septum site-determining protein MinC